MKMTKRLSQKILAKIDQLDVLPPTDPEDDRFVDKEWALDLKLCLAFFQEVVPLRMTEDQYMENYCRLFELLGKETRKEEDASLGELEKLDKIIKEGIPGEGTKKRDEKR